jgi:hypothetical protein
VQVCLSVCVGSLDWISDSRRDCFRRSSMSVNLLKEISYTVVACIPTPQAHRGAPEYFISISSASKSQESRLTTSMSSSKSRDSVRTRTVPAQRYSPSIIVHKPSHRARAQPFICASSQPHRGDFGAGTIWPSSPLESRSKWLASGRIHGSKSVHCH